MVVTETLIFYAFSITNVGRLLAYLPQILLLLRERGPAAVISALTWTAFMVSNGTTAGYAAFVLNDRGMTLIFGANMLCCAAIVALVLYRRQQWQHVTRQTSVMLQTAS